MWLERILIPEEEISHHDDDQDTTEGGELKIMIGKAMAKEFRRHFWNYSGCVFQLLVE